MSREEFEKFPKTAGILAETGIYYSHVNNRYTSNHEKGHEAYLCGFVNGAYYAFQEQQKKIDDILNLVCKLQHSSGNRIFKEVKEKFNESC